MNKAKRDSPEPLSGELKKRMKKKRKTITKEINIHTEWWSEEQNVRLIAFYLEQIGRKFSVVRWKLKVAMVAYRVFRCQKFTEIDCILWFSYILQLIKQCGRSYSISWIHFTGKMITGDV